MKSAILALAIFGWASASLAAVTTTGQVGTQPVTGTLIISSSVPLTVTTNGAPLPVTNQAGLLADVNGLGLNVALSATVLGSGYAIKGNGMLSLPFYMTHSNNIPVPGSGVIRYSVYDPITFYADAYSVMQSVVSIPILNVTGAAQAAKYVRQGGTPYSDSTVIRAMAAAIYSVGAVGGVTEGTLTVSSDTGATLVIPSGVNFYTLSVGPDTGTTSVIYSSPVDIATAFAHTGGWFGRTAETWRDATYENLNVGPLGTTVWMAPGGETQKAYYSYGRVK